MGQIWPITYFSKASLEHWPTHSSTFIFCEYFLSTMPELCSCKDCMSSKVKICTTWPFTRKLCQTFIWRIMCTCRKVNLFMDNKENGNSRDFAVIRRCIMWKHLSVNISAFYIFNRCLTKISLTIYLLIYTEHIANVN